MNAARLSCLLLVAGAVAQTNAVVPPHLDAVEGSSFGTLAGFERRQRQQILIDGSALTALSGKTISALSVRRDDALGQTLAPSAGRVRVSLFASARPVSGPARAFAQNRSGVARVVFDGVVSLPLAPPLAPPLTWQAPHAVALAFTTPFAYAGGDLGIEIEGEPLAPPNSVTWPVDYEHAVRGGMVQALGTPCGAATQSFATTAGAWARALVPGWTLSVAIAGRAATPAVLLLGAVASAPVPLDPIGAPGCALYVQPQVALFDAFPASWGGHAFTLRHFELDLPSQPVLLGASFGAQGANLETTQPSNPAGITTSNGLRLTMTTQLPAPLLSTVLSEPVDPGVAFPASGRVEVGRGPVLRFDAQ